jgi:hypothetical protein
VTAVVASATAAAAHPTRSKSVNRGEKTCGIGRSDRDNAIHLVRQQSAAR